MKLNPDATGQQVNKKELAQIFGISERTFTELQRDPDFPFVKDGDRGEKNVYDTAQVLRFLLNRLADKSAAGESELSRAKTDQARTDTALKRLSYHEKLSNTVYKQEALQLLSAWSSFATQEYRESVDGLIIDIQDQFKIEVPRDLREKYVTATNDRVRGYVQKLGGSSACSGRDLADAERISND